MKIKQIEFKNLILDIEEQEFKEINFNYKEGVYSIKIYLYNNNLYVYKHKEYISKIEINKIIKGKEIDLIFSQENLKNDKDLSLKTLFSKYKLGVMEYYA